MRYDTPLRKQHDEYAHRLAAELREMGGDEDGDSEAGPPVAVEYLSYGDPDEHGDVTCEIVATFGPVEAEYAAIRKGAGILDAAHRGTLRVTGADRRAFLNSMLTQELADLEAGVVKAAFWLSRTGRIDADLLVIELGDEIFIDVDVSQAAATAKSLNSYIFSEEVVIKDVTGAYHHISVHGAEAGDVLAAAVPGGLSLEPHRAARVEISGVGVIVARRDLTGEPGYEVIAPRDEAATVWTALCAGDDAAERGRRRVRPIGWYAFNVARIEAGTPVFNVDFGCTNLPHETGILAERVCFTKGCYLGQEIVARVENLGRPKQTLVGLRVEADRLPLAGASVHERSGDGPGEVIGVITSSTLSPMCSAAPVAFAMVGIKHVQKGSTVSVNAEGEQVEATIQGLCFWSRNV